MIDVVIIEDDPMVSMITEKIISSNDKFNVIKTFTSGEGVVEYLIENQIELIILDMYLPDTEGLDILEELREKEIEKDVYVNAIFVTASNSKAHIKKAFQLGVVDYLIKPFEFERLEMGLNRYLAKKSEKSIDKNLLTQEELDNLYHNSHDTKPIRSLPKGISKTTLNKIMEVVMSDTEKEWSSKEVADIIDSSTVTVKKYLDYLSEVGKIKSDIYHGTVGRPEVKYKIIV